MIIDGEEFLRNPGTILENVQDYLSIPKLLWKEDFVKHQKTGFFCYQLRKNFFLKNLTLSPSETAADSLKCLPKEKGRSRNGIRTMSEESKTKLNEFYASYNQKFSDAVGMTFTWT